MRHTENFESCNFYLEKYQIEISSTHFQNVN